MEVGRCSLQHPGSIWLVLAALMLMGLSGASAAPPTPEEYMLKVGAGAHIVPAGELTIDGHKVTCGNRPTVMDTTLDDYGAAYPGFLILNPTHLAKVKSTVVKLWIHAHECGHQFRGEDEETADCFAVQRGATTGLAHTSRIRGSVQVHGARKRGHYALQRDATVRCHEGMLRRQIN